MLMLKKKKNASWHLLKWELVRLPGYLITWESEVAVVQKEGLSKPIACE